MFFEIYFVENTHGKHCFPVHAKDSWEIFQNNNLNVQPTDKVLNLYLATALEMQTQMGHS